MEEVQGVLIEIPVPDQMIEQRLQRGPEAVAVHHDDRLGMQPELLPGQDLQCFIEGADSAGQDREGIGEFIHAMLALVHVRDFDELGQAGMADLLLHQMGRNDADRFTAPLHDGVCDHAHQADTAAAEHQPYAICRQILAECLRGVPVTLRASIRRCAEDSNCIGLAHSAASHARRSWSRQERACDCTRLAVRRTMTPMHRGNVMSLSDFLHAMPSERSSSDH